MFDSQVIAYSIVAAVLTITLGTDTMLVQRNVIRGGRRDGFGTTLGICSGLYIHAIFSALGLSFILAQSVAAFHTVKIAGALYLVWLGFQSLKKIVTKDFGDLKSPDTKTKIVLKQSFMEGFLTNILNPKVAIFYLSILTQFIEDGDPVFAKSLLLAGIHYGMGIIWLGGISILLSSARAWVRSARFRKVLNGFSGTILIALGIKLAFEGR
jgi:RhtB (resistance to homoserine/threonine) family protein